MARPPSATHYGFNLVGVLCATIAIFVLRARQASDSNAVLLVIAAGVVPILLLDVFVLRVHRRPSTGIDWDKPDEPDGARYLTKILGLAVTVGLIALAYYVFPEYGDWYGTFFNTMRRFGLVLIAFALVYFYWMDGRLREPKDAYWQLGRVFLGHPEDVNRKELANHFRSWLIKAFFLPLFIVFVHNQISGILRWNLSNLHDLQIKNFATDLIYALDVLYAVVGYCLSLRIIDSHVRSAEPTMLGWVVALECYQPFWGRLSSALYLHYEGIGFESWLAPYPTVRWGWAGVIVILELIYLLATFSFGLRFSNLTHRGILANGPYRFSKHPAYVAKNLSWWMTTVPFIPHMGIAQAFKSSLCLAGVSTVYFLRARTEEKHLSRDPEYVAYATWMNENGWLKFLNRIPGIRYVPPAPAVCAPALPSAPEAAPAQ